ncbi:conjugal transfer nickase/helicase TraI [Yersinia enterocolitica]|nr:conjugal transfer nickase/helicase TraI [Yersinia enterocolitica]CNF58779.1 conjugal transfer nickase/helicase TraI [Yersinia enterocolitica]
MSPCSAVCPAQSLWASTMQNLCRVRALPCIHLSRGLPLMQGFASPLRSPSPSFSSAVIFRSFARSDTDRGYVTNSLWEVAGFTEDGAVRFRQGDQEKIVDPQKVTEDLHIDLAYALTAYGVQGASERFVIALFGAEGGRKRMATLHLFT